MTQKTMNGNNQARAYITALCGILLALVLCATTAYAENPRAATVRLGHDGHSALLIRVENCTVFVEPSDGEKVDCTFDSGALRIAHGKDGEAYQLGIQSLSGRRMGFEAAATISVPSGAFEHVTIETNNAEVMLSHGLDCAHTIDAVDSRIGIQHTNGGTRPYAIQLRRSMCDFVIDEHATDYAVEVRMAGGLLSVPAGGMPAPVKGSAYNYTTGKGISKITVDNLTGSYMNFVFARRMQ